jgi:hypothetical protein
MRIFHDWEFLEDGETIKPISVAMLSEDGWMLYRAFDDLAYRNGPLYEGVTVHEFLMAEVVPHLPLEPGTKVVQPRRPAPSEPGLDFDVRVPGLVPGSFFLDRTNPFVQTRQAIRDLVSSFVADAAARDQGKVELWGWYSAYDHVCLAQLFGPMVKMPRHIPKHTDDLKTRQRQLDIPDSQLPGHGDKNHNPADEVALMRDWARWMDGLETYSTPPIKAL